MKQISLNNKEYILIEVPDDAPKRYKIKTNRVDGQLMTYVKT